MIDEAKLCMKFDTHTIEHLGISMYSKLPPVLGELVSNGWDADATEIVIDLHDEDPQNKAIIIRDNGNGMGFEDINDKFLLIGRNRRKSDGTDVSLGGRKVIGRKGIGKLSIFGIANDIFVKTIKDGYINQFKLSLEDMKKEEGFYYPQHIIQNVKSSEENGTIIELKQFKRKSDFDPQNIAYDLAKRFLIFGDDFKVRLLHNGKDPIMVTNELRFENAKTAFEWTFPNTALVSTYSHKNDVDGVIYGTSKPVPANMKGIYLVARGKIVHKNDFFGIRSDDFAYSYLTGWLNVDFIDESIDEDLISTNRESLNWEHEKTEALQNYLHDILKFVALDLKKKKRLATQNILKKETGLDVEQWVDQLPAPERSLAKKTTEIILDSPDLDIDKTEKLMNYIKDVFDDGTFKDFINTIYQKDVFTEYDLIELFRDWQIIEAKEMYKLALVRIKTIEEFEKKIAENAKEVPVMHNFLKKFPWLLDPRIHQFNDEVRYSTLLRDKFNDDTIPESDRRIDFLCVDFADTIFIIELKRPSMKANDKSLDQALEYAAFLKSKQGNDPDFGRRNIKTYLVCNGLVNSETVKMKAKAYSDNGVVYVRTYEELLSAARKYHQEFIDKYNTLKSET